MLTYSLKKTGYDKRKLWLSLQSWGENDTSFEHIHDCVEVVHVIRGTGVNLIDRKPHIMIAGDLYVIRRNSVHEIRSNAGLMFYNLMFNFSFFSSGELKKFHANPSFESIFSPMAQFAKLSLAPPLSRRISGLFEQMWREFSDRPQGYELNTKAYLILILNELCRLKNDSPAVVTTVNSCLARLLKFLNAHYLTTVSGVDAANAARLSPRYVGDFFKRQTGVTIVEYLQNLRMEHACQLLRKRPDLPLSTIASQSGFASGSYFAKIFLRKTGCTPTEFRLQMPRVNQEEGFIRK